MGSLGRGAIKAYREFSQKEPAASFSIILSAFAIGTYGLLVSYRRKNDSRNRPEHRYWGNVKEEVILHPPPPKFFRKFSWDEEKNQPVTHSQQVYQFPTSDPTLSSYFEKKK